MWLLVWHVGPAAALKEPDTSLPLTLAASLAIKILEGKPPDFLGKQNYFAAVIKMCPSEKYCVPTGSRMDSHADFFYWKTVPDHHISIGYKNYTFLFK